MAPTPPTIEAALWEEEPYPPDEFPDKTDDNRRFFCYRGVSAYLFQHAGIPPPYHRRRVEHTACVMREVMAHYGKGKVGFEERPGELAHALPVEFARFLIPPPIQRRNIVVVNVKPPAEWWAGQLC